MFEEKRVVIWDTEYTSWEGCNENGWDNEKDEYKEIIQIGAVIYDTEEQKIIDSFDKAVNPQINPELSDYIKELTGITQERVKKADKFDKVLKQFLEWSSGLQFYSYRNDLGVVKRNKELYNLNIILEEERFHDITPYFSNAGVPVDDWNSGDIAHYYDPDKELLPQHDAFHDAKNMAEAVKLAQRNNSQ